jgi:hypothetical protein
MIESGNLFSRKVSHFFYTCSYQKKNCSNLCLFQKIYPIFVVEFLEKNSGLLY